MEFERLEKILREEEFKAILKGLELFFSDVAEDKIKEEFAEFVNFLKEKLSYSEESVSSENSKESEGSQDSGVEVEETGGEDSDVEKVENFENYLENPVFLSTAFTAYLAQKTISTLSSELVKLKRQVSFLEDRARSYAEAVQSLKDEFNRLKERQKREIEEIKKRAEVDLIEAILPVLDSMQMALEHGIDEEGLKVMLRQFITSLEKMGLEEVGKEGEEFDPELHEAVGREEAPDESSVNLIAKVHRKGYKFREKLLRPALVVVYV